MDVIAGNATIYADTSEEQESLMVEIKEILSSELCANTEFVSNSVVFGGMVGTSGKNASGVFVDIHEMLSSIGEVLERGNGDLTEIRFDPMTLGEAYRYDFDGAEVIMSVFDYDKTLVDDSDDWTILWSSIEDD